MSKANPLVRAAALALMLLIPFALGCETKAVRLVVPGFGNGNIDGIWLWRRADGSNQYVRACRIELYEPEKTFRGEELPYFQVCDGQEGFGGMDLKASISRLPSDPSAIVVDLWYFRFAPPGQFKASSYNAAGESTLSTTTLPL